MEKAARHNVQNIYLSEESSNNFVKNIRYDNAALKKVAHLTYEYFMRHKNNFINILDIGIGSGAFTVPILEYLECQNNINYHLECFDISDKMLLHLEEALSYKPFIKKKVHLDKMDANEGLRNYYNKWTYDLIIITFVLHYIKNWKSLTKDVFCCLKKGGLFLQAEIIGDLRNVDGKFDVNSPKLFEKFWKEYFKKRRIYSSWEPYISVTDLSLVMKYCLRQLKFKILKEKYFYWKTTIMWKDLIDWIKCAPVSSLGSNLSELERFQLSTEMNNWLIQNKIKEENFINIRWGFKIIWMVKL
jgi:SAM-dependent methyltransferase